MKKRFLLIFLILSLIMAVGCENEDLTGTTNQDTDNIEEIEDETGVTPYTLSDENKDLLKILNLERKANILSFKAPRSVKNIKANIYILDETGIWKEIDRLSKKVEDRHFYNNDILKGTFSMIIDGAHTKEMVIKLGSSKSGIMMDERDSLIDREAFEEAYVGSSRFLEDFKNIELNKEIPVAIMIENKGEEIILYNINSFFDTATFEEVDYVQAVTLIFED